MLDRYLTGAEISAARYFVWRILEEIPAELIQASIFGSKARGEARSDSDVDILLVFRALPPDREPHAGMAEATAEQVAAQTGVPVTVWSVSLPDLAPGERTPMLVDALEDAIPIWCWPQPLLPVSFMPADALRCSTALLERVREGSLEFADRALDGDAAAAARRARDDVVRLGTALLLLKGMTRFRRGEVVEELLTGDFAGSSPPAPARLVLDWVRLSFGPSGRDEDRPIVPPPGGLLALTRTVDYLRGQVRRAAHELAAARSVGTPFDEAVYS
ncbi:MAG TPA: nucleotidyltransferase domain-containing protein [Longimicrobiaceae bacterium]|nr:nucleotidyltransferase domain-containing protein [Longimicrobiaceae bacterium]